MDNGLNLKYQNDVRAKIKAKHPRLYQVLLLNDHYTTMEFVVEVLVEVFGKTVEDASQIMLDIHKNGKGVGGIYPLDIAKTKVVAVANRAKAQGFPLRILCEPV